MSYWAKSLTLCVLIKNCTLSTRYMANALLCWECLQNTIGSIMHPICLNYMYIATNRNELCDPKRNFKCGRESNSRRWTNLYRPCQKYVLEKVLVNSQEVLKAPLLLYSKSVCVRSPTKISNFGLKTTKRWDFSRKSPYYSLFFLNKKGKSQKVIVSSLTMEKQNELPGWSCQ